MALPRAEQRELVADKNGVEGRGMDRSTLKRTLTVAADDPSPPSDRP
jgi:hypothetical protein